MREAVWTTQWTTPPLAGNEVHIWRVNLDAFTPASDLLAELLAEDEQARAARFRSDRDRGRYTVTRALLRFLLAGYLETEARGLALRYNASGKPFLDEGWDLRFNVSHSKGLALLAFTTGRDVGVDLEEVREIPDWDSIAVQFFSKREVKTLFELEPSDQMEAFFLCWTRKEAYLKAKGEGLSQGLNAFDVSLIPGEPARLLRSPGGRAELGRWRLESLSPADGFVGAVAAEGQDWRLQLCELELPAWSEDRA